MIFIVVTWDFEKTDDNDTEYAKKSDRANEFCKDKLGGFRISQSTWISMPSIGDSTIVGKKFIAHIENGGLKLKKPRRDPQDENKLTGGDRVSVFATNASYHTEDATWNWLSGRDLLIRVLRESLRSERE